MVHFQQLFHMTMINKKLKEKIETICKSKEGEICGFIVFLNNEYEFLEVDNKHPSYIDNFLISPIDYLNIKKNYSIKYLFHTHNNSDSFSKTDIYYQKFHNLDMLLYNKNTNNWSEMKCKQ